MMNPFCKAAACFLSLLVIQPTFAQQGAPFVPGYVVTAAGDTLRGEVTDQIDALAARSVQFRPEPGAAGRMYSPAEIQGYGLDSGRRFVVLVVPPFAGRPAEPLFARPLVEGDALSLYTFAAPVPRMADDPDALSDRGDPTRYAVQGPGGQAVGLYYLRRLQRDGGLQMVQDAQYRRALAVAFAECPDEQRRTARLPYRQRELSAAVLAYNACVGAAFVVAPGAEAARQGDIATEFAVRVSAGPKRFSHHYGRMYSYPEPRDLKSAGGRSLSVEAIADHKLLLINPRLSVPVGLSFNLTSADEAWLSDKPSWPNYFSAEDFNRSRIALSVGTRYTLPMGRAGTSVAAGFLSGYLLGDKQTVYSHIALAHFPSWEAGWYAEVSSRAAVSPRLSPVEVGLRYETTGIGYMNPFQGPSNSSWRTSSVSGALGVRF